MNHVVRILIVAGLSIAAVLIILLSTGHFGPQTHMDVFIAETIHSAMGQNVEIEQYVEANLPRRLQRDMVSAWHYRSAPYSKTLPMSAWGPIATTDQVMTYPVEIFTCCSRPLPYPPEDLWCVKLKSADPTIPKIILIAFHKDVYTASWVMHEPIDAETVLSAVDCQFATQ